MTLTDDRRAVYLHIGRAGHPTQDASVAAGADQDGATGTAPAARFVLTDLGEHGDWLGPSVMVEALVASARHPDVDVISISVSFPQAWPLSGTDVVAIIARRVMAAYGKPIVHSAGNEYAWAKTGHLGVAGLEVGAFMPGELAHRYLGLPDKTSHLAYYTTRGPRADGDAKPDVLGPVTELAASICPERSSTDRRARFVTLPPCYLLSSGTSAAAPAIAGLVASLVSGLKSQGVQPRAEAIYASIRESAMPLSGVSVAAQGAGVPRADVAWRLLSRERAISTIESRSSVRTALASYLPTAGEGAGLFEREGWVREQSGRRVLRLRQDDGPSLVHYRTRLAGDIDSFTVPKRITLRRGIETVVPIEITARRSGVLSALLILEDPSGRTAPRQHQLTIVVPDARLSAAADKSSLGHTYRGTLGPFASRDVVIDVAAGTPFLSVSFAAATELGLMMHTPGGWAYQRDELVGLSRVGSSPANSAVLIPQPTPGTWIFRIFRGSSEALAVAQGTRDYTLRVAAIDVTTRLTDAREAGQSTLQVGVSGASAIGLRSFAARTFSGAHNLSADGTPLLLPFTVEQGTELAQWQVVGKDKDVAAHAYLYDCTKGYCVRRDVSVPASRSYIAAFERPAPGNWILVLTAGPDQRGVATLTVDFSVATTNGRSSVRGDVAKITPEHAYVHTLDTGCDEFNDRRSLLLQVADLSGPTPVGPAAMSRPDKLVPTLPILTLSGCRPKTSAGNGQAAAPK